MCMNIVFHDMSVHRHDEGLLFLTAFCGPLPRGSHRTALVRNKARKSFAITLLERGEEVARAPITVHHSCNENIWWVKCLRLCCGQLRPRDIHRHRMPIMRAHLSQRLGASERGTCRNHLASSAQKTFCWDQRCPVDYSDLLFRTFRPIGAH